MPWSDRFGTAGPLLAGIGAVVLWSTAATVAGLLTGYVGFAAIAFYPVLFAAIVFGLYSLSTGGTLTRDLLALSSRGWEMLLAAGFFLSLYEFFFFYSLTHAPRIEANIINYLWPIFLVGTSIIMGTKEARRIPATDWAFMLLAFVGAIFIAVDPEKWTALRFDEPAYLSALLGAVSIGIYFAIAVRLREHFGNAFNSWLATVVFATPMILAGSLVFGFDLSLPTLAVPIALLVYEGVVVFGMGYLLWVFAIQKYESLSLSSIVYLTPLVSMLWLNSVLKDEINASALYGAALIVISNFAIHSRYRYTSATNASIIFTLLVGLMCFLTKGQGKQGEAVASIGLLGTVFAILCAFTLNRIVAKNRSEEERQTEVGVSAFRLIMAADELGDQGTQDRIRARVDGLLRRMVDYDYCGRADNREAMTTDIYRALELLRSEIGGLRVLAAPDSSALRDVEPELIESLDHWLVLKAERLGSGERLALWVLGVLTALAFIVSRKDSLMGDIWATAFVSGVVFILFTVRDYDKNRPDRDFGKIMVSQRAFKRAGLKYYLPADIVEAKRFPFPSQEQEFRYEVDGTMGEEAVTPEGKAGRLLLSVVFSAAFVALFYLLLSKHVA